jgi:hypothetical protein
LHNKVALSGGGSASVFTAVQRCSMLRALIEQEDGEASTLCRVINYECEHGKELLTESPSYWAPRLPGGYLRTVPTMTLLKHLAHQVALQQTDDPRSADAPPPRLAAVFGVDNLAGMATWNEPARLLACADLVLLERGMEQVAFPVSPTSLLAGIHHVDVRACVPVVHGERTFFGRSTGTFRNSTTDRSTAADGALYLLPALAGQDEHLSSTSIRAAVTDCLVAFDRHGASRSSAASIFSGGGDGSEVAAAILNDASVNSALVKLRRHGYDGTGLSLLFQGAVGAVESLLQIGSEAAARGERTPGSTEVDEAAHTGAMAASSMIGTSCEGTCSSTTACGGATSREDSADATTKRARTA